MPTNIAWTDETWNPIHGCSRVSAGCDNCYAEQLSYERHGWTDKPWTAENAEENVTLKPERLEPGGDGHPANYDEPKRIFVNSMSDVFHSEVPEEFIRDLFAEMRNYPEHVFQILTKRPGRAAEMEIQWPPNVWMGTSVEDKRVSRRLDLLRECEAETLFVSFEPLIGPVGEIDLTGFDWVIVGGESGPDYRDMAHEWVWPIKEEAERVGAAFFFKQSAAFQNETEPYLRCRDGVRREFDELPQLNAAVKRARENNDKQLVADGGTEGHEADLPHAVTKRPDDPEARRVWVEMYPGGDAMIELGGIDCDKELYLSSGEPEALLEALEDLSERKEGDDGE